MRWLVILSLGCGLLVSCRDSSPIAQLDGPTAFKMGQQIAQKRSQGRKDPRLLEQEAQYYRRACEANHAAGCTAYGFMRESGLGAHIDHSQAMKNYQRGCEKGDLAGCYRLAQAHGRGLLGRPDYAQARNIYLSACQRKHADSCFELGRLAERGLVTKVDRAQALQYYQQACALDSAKGCFAQGQLLRRDEKGKDGWHSLFEKACRLTYVPSCIALSSHYEEGQDNSNYLKYLSAACALRSGAACLKAALFYDRSPDKKPEHQKKSLHFHRLACEHGKYAVACQIVAERCQGNQECSDK